MRSLKIICFLLLPFLFSGLSAQEIQVDIITNMNDVSRFIVRNDSIFAATSGGLLIYDLGNDSFQSLTAGDGFFSQNFTSLEIAQSNVLALGSIDGIVSFAELQSSDIYNDVSLKGKDIVDMVAVDDTLWVLAKKLLAVYQYNGDEKRFRFLDFFENFGEEFSNFNALHYAKNKIWLGSTDGLFYAPSDFTKNNLKSASTWNRLTTGNGLPGNSVNDMAGSDSLFYIVTSGGLAVVDFPQVSPLLFGSRDKLHLHGNDIYTSNTNSIFKYSDGSSFTVKTFNNGTINDFSVDEAGNIWVALAQRGISKLNGEKDIFIDGPSDNYVGQVYIDRRGWLWCTSELYTDERKKGIYLRTDNEWLNFKFFGPQTWNNLSSTLFVLEDSDGNIWISSWGGGITIFDKNLNITAITHNSVPGSVWIKSMTVDDTLTVSTPPELQNIVQNVPTHPTYSVVTGLFYDTGLQSIWFINLFPNTGKAIVQYRDTKFSEEAASDPNSWRYYTHPFQNRIFPNHLYKITKDIFDIYWIASDRHGMIRMQTDENGVPIGWDTIDESNNLKSNEVLDVEADQDGYVWIATKAGLSAYLGGTVFDFREEYQPVGLKINDVFIDSQNNKWFATNEGVSLLRSSGSPFDANSWFHIVPRVSDIVRSNTFFADLPSKNIHSIFLDESSGDIYLGTDSGIAIIRSNPFAAAFTDFNSTKLGPNPFTIEDGTSADLRFYNLIAGSQIKILTASGQLIRTLDPDNFEEIQGSQGKWDGKTESGDFASTGVYLYLITTEGGQHTSGKFLVINKRTN